MNIRVDLNTPIKDGTEVVFRSPVDCSQVTGLIVYYNGGTDSQEFAFADAHGNNVGDIDHLFAENVAVKVILDVTTSMAFVQNADTNAYLEGRFAELAKAIANVQPGGGGNTIHCGDWRPGEIYQSEVGIKYKVGDLYLVDTEYDYGIYELVGIYTESDSDLAFPEWELKYVPRSPNNTPRVEEFNFDWCTTLDDFIDLLNAENGYEDSCEKTEGEYDGQIVVVSDVGDHGMDKDCSGAAIWVNTPKGYVWKKITQDYDKESIVADVIASLPVYDGSVV